MELEFSLGVTDVEVEVVEVQYFEDESSEGLPYFVGFLCGHEFGDVGADLLFDLLF